MEEQEKKKVQQDTGNGSETLTPWYAIHDEPSSRHAFAIRNSATRRVSARSRQWESENKAYTQSVEAMFRGRKWLITVFKNARDALGGQPYTDDDSRAWFCREREKGLCDVFYFQDDWAKEPLQPEDKRGIVCFYADGRTCYFTFAIGQDDSLSLVEKKLVVAHWKKPQLTDNTKEFVAALMEMVYCTEGWWSDNFREAARMARKGDLMAAVAKSETGGGMGSFSESHDYKPHLAQRLSAERQKALLYAINYGKKE